ncbi:hypothetical protein THTE_0238 [Thermogutta terrifontis]|uniref:Uncharacterized protein n=1 Tax=Thermogutta terrifontis TaxID=1331910 RepID=A0A286RA61_9BACT|nr:hypothetical protein THTE_0238 [Thermogutta terrifontis]
MPIDQNPPTITSCPAATIERRPVSCRLSKMLHCFRLTRMKEHPLQWDLLVVPGQAGLMIKG